MQSPALERALDRVSTPAPRSDVQRPRRAPPALGAPHASTTSPAREPALEGLAGLAARASPPLAPAAKAPKGEPPLPAVLEERMEEAELARRLERILRREAEQAGVDLEGFDP
jgi:hypothetical protein